MSKVARESVELVENWGLVSGRTIRIHRANSGKAIVTLSSCRPKETRTRKFSGETLLDAYCEAAQFVKDSEKAAATAVQQESLTECILWLCPACLDGRGGECHTPGCSLFMSRAPDLSLRGCERTKQLEQGDP